MPGRKGWRKNRAEMPEAFGAIITPALNPEAELSRAKKAWDTGGSYGAMLAALQVCEAHNLALP